MKNKISISDLKKYIISESTKLLKIETLKEEKIKIYDKNVKINRGIDNMIDDIDKMLDE